MCPVCFATAVSQAAIPVASAVGGAVAARVAMKQKPKAQRGEPIRIETVKSTEAKLSSVPVAVKREEIQSRST